jgi:hypothetical protein
MTARRVAVDDETQEAARTYQATLERATADGNTAGGVIDQLADLAIGATNLAAGARGVPYDEALTELFSFWDTSEGA